MRFGGLDGDGIICNNAPGAIGTMVYFQAQQGKTFTGGDFTGTFSKWFISSESNIKIVMDGGSGGTQTPKPYARAKPPRTVATSKRQAAGSR